jgi:hypothetical protein
VPGGSDFLSVFVSAGDLVIVVGFGRSVTAGGAFAESTGFPFALLVTLGSGLVGMLDGVEDAVIGTEEFDGLGSGGLFAVATRAAL